MYVFIGMIMACSGCRPKTLSEFKKTEPKEYVELGSLGADLDSDELIAKRANRARIKHFSSALREVNKEVRVVLCVDVAVV